MPPRRKVTSAAADAAATASAETTDACTTIVMELPAAAATSSDVAWYTAATPQDRAAALKLGVQMHTLLKSMKSTSEVQEIEARKNAELAAIREQSAAQIAAAEEAVATAQQEKAKQIGLLLEAQKSEFDARTAAERETHTARIRALEGELACVNERYEALVERRRVLEEGRDADVRIAEERTRLLLQHALDEKERAIQRADRSLVALQEAYARQTEELRALGDLIRRKPTNVKVKGSEYEAMFREKLVAAFGLGENFSIVDSARSGIGHAGDYLMRWGDHTVMWEVKNYDKPVPTAEVDKFRRDMKENSEVRVGVMVSRYTPITGKTATGDREVEFMEGKLLVYLSAFEYMSDDTLPSLMMLFRLWWEHDHTKDEEDESRTHAIRQVERLHAAAVKARTEWRLHKSRMDDALRWMAEVVEETETRLQNTLNILHGYSTVIEVPPGLFRDVGGDERAQSDVQLILRFARAETGAALVMNDLVDCFSREKGVSRDTARTHIRSVLLDSAIEQQKGKPTRVLGLRLEAAVATGVAAGGAGCV